MQSYSATSKGGGVAPDGVRGTEEVADFYDETIPTLDIVVSGKLTGPLQQGRLAPTANLRSAHTATTVEATPQLSARANKNGRRAEKDIPTLTVVVPTIAPVRAPALADDIAPPIRPVRATRTALSPESVPLPHGQKRAVLSRGSESKEIVSDTYLHLCLLGLGAALISAATLWWYQSSRLSPKIDVIIQEPKIEFAAPVTPIAAAGWTPMTNPTEETPPEARAPAIATALTAEEPAAQQAVSNESNPAPANIVPAVIAAPDVESLLEDARNLLEEGYIIWPDEENAVSLLKDVLKTEPNNEQALAMLEDAAANLTAQAARAYDDGFKSSAVQVLNSVLAFYPTYLPAIQLRAESNHLGAAE